MIYCKGCLNKQQKINELEEEITSLKGKLRYQERTGKEGKKKGLLKKVNSFVVDRNKIF